MRNEYITLENMDVVRLQELLNNDKFEVIGIDLYNQVGHKVNFVIIKIKYKHYYTIEHEHVYIIEEYKFNDLRSIEFDARGLLESARIDKKIVFKSDYDGELVRDILQNTKTVE